MKGYTDRSVQTLLLHSSSKSRPELVPDCTPSPTKLDPAQLASPLTSPIHLTLGATATQHPAPAGSSSGSETWDDLVARQVFFGDPTLDRHASTMNQRQLEAMEQHHENPHPTWDELVKQGAMLGDDGTDTLVMKKKTPLFT